MGKESSATCPMVKETDLLKIAPLATYVLMTDTHFLDNFIKKSTHGRFTQSSEMKN